MPNLNLISSLREKYRRESPLRYQDMMEFIKEQDLYKFILKEKGVAESDRKKLLLDFKTFSISNPKPEIIRHFETNTKENVSIIFIDITNFSTRFAGRTTNEIKTILDEYYNAAIPIIYDYDGEIEKLIGDGIIAVFGKPFSELSTDRLFQKGVECSKALVKRFKNTIKEVKVAFHFGEVMYYKTGSDLYEEYTMIGNTLTELFRLESVSENNSVNFFELGIDKDSGIKSSFLIERGWSRTDNNETLKGLGNRKVIRYLRNQ